MTTHLKEILCSLGHVCAKERLAMLQLCFSWKQLCLFVSYHYLSTSEEPFIELCAYFFASRLSLVVRTVLHDQYRSTC